MTRAVAAALCVVALVARARGQPSPAPGPPTSPPPTPVATCEPCARAQANLDQLDVYGAVLRNSVRELASLEALGIRGMTLTYEQHEQLERRIAGSEREAVSAYIDRYGDAGVRDLAALVCGVADSGCVEGIYHALVCTGSSRCAVDPFEQREMSRPPTCDPYAHTYKGTKVGYGGEVTTGWRDSAQPNDHRAWGFGIEARRRVKKRLGGVARLDWQTGRDAGIDGDGDGRDDDGTGRVSRVSVLAGPSVRITEVSRNSVWRYLEVDVLGGYSLMTSPNDEDGAVAAIDLAYQLGPTRWGLRAMQGFGDASDARSVLFHAGIVGTTHPDRTVVGGCDFVRNEEPPSTGFALGFDLGLGGYELASGIGFMVPTPAVEIAYIVTSQIQAIGRGDLTVFTNGGADHVLHHSLFAGLRLDMTPSGHKQDRTGPFITLLGGYGWGAVTRPSTAGSGPVVDGSLGYMIQGDDGAGWVRLHGRFGVTRENEDLRAMFLSVGLELRLDGRRWRSRDN